MIPRMPPLIPVNTVANKHNQELVKKIENTQRPSEKPAITAPVLDENWFSMCDRKSETQCI